MAEPRDVGSSNERVWAANVAGHLRDVLVAERGAAVTWYNHASVLRSISAQVDVSRFDSVGIDGFFLRRMVAPGGPRTSADLVLPLLLGSLPARTRVALIGSRPASLEAAKEVIESLPSAPAVVFTCDGYDGLLPPAQMANWLRALGVQLVVIGLGAPRQDTYLLELVREGLTTQVLVTAGGWLDQIGVEGYYPAWAYRCRANWLVRVIREPGRLWRRYTVDALRALRAGDVVRTFVLERGRIPFEAMTTTSLSAGPASLDSVSGRPVAV